VKPERPRRLRVDGILLLDKPKGLGSTPALARARGLLEAQKGGHGGTLDPMASGLLPLMFGEATKFAADALEADKTYLAELTLGIRTNTGDAEGEVCGRSPVRVSEAGFRAACEAFVGPIDQVPPMHSALKRDGKPLYEYARAGIELERAARRVTIHRIEVIDCVLAVEPPRATIRVACSKGTYIRVLAADIGDRLGCGAHLSMLRRERVGSLSVTDAIGLDELAGLEPGQRRARLAPVDALLAGLPRVDLDARAAARFRNGQRLPASVFTAADLPEGRVRVYADARLLGLAMWRNRVLAPLRLVAVESGAEPVPDAVAMSVPDKIAQG
jgi:tRNA pseudouridine55 synthase